MNSCHASFKTMHHWLFGSTLNLKIIRARSALTLILAGEHHHRGLCWYSAFAARIRRSSSYTLYFHDNRAVRCSAYQSQALIKKLLYSCWRHCLDLVRNGLGLDCHSGRATSCTGDKNIMDSKTKPVRKQVTNFQLLFMSLSHTHANY